VVRRSTGRTLRFGVSALRDAAGEGDGLIVAVFGRLTGDDARAVARARRGSATCVAILMGPSEDPGAVTALRMAGWRVLSMNSVAELPAAWGASGEPIAGAVRESK
jgi:hypothetical protein